MIYEIFYHWKSISPSVVRAVKFGASSPNLIVLIFSIVFFVLKELKVNFEDRTPEFIEGDDYPEYAEDVGTLVVKKKTKGILICGSGVGISIAANKIPGVRAVLCYDKDMAQKSRQHNNTNILALSGWKKYSKLKEIIDTWLNTKFDGEASNV